MSTTPLNHSKDSINLSIGGISDVLSYHDIEGNKKRRSKSPSIPSYNFKRQLTDPSDSANIDDNETPEEISKQYKKFINAAKFNLNSEEVFCICRKPDHGGELMISCDGCDEWFHFKCMKLIEENSKLISKFYCKFCQWKGNGTTKWKRKCRLDWCLEPAKADENSKYCSEEHGIIFMNEYLMNSNKSIQDLKLEQIKDVLNYVDTNYEKFAQLGMQFPELAEVIEFKENNKTDKFPLEIQNKLSFIEEKLNVTKKLIQLYESRIGIITKYKELIKIINDLLKRSLLPELLKENDKSKKSKGKSNSKTIEICCFNKTFNTFKYGNVNFDLLNTCDNIYESFKEYIDNFVSFVEKNKKEGTGFNWFDDTVCIQDKKRCLRHNGWGNVITDELSKKIDELTALFEELDKKKLHILRDYSNSVYEANSPESQ